MIDRPRAAVSWSGGKDSCAALRRARENYEVVAMVTMVDEHGTRSRSHGLRPEVLSAQAARLGLRSVLGRCTWDTYDVTFECALTELVESGVTHVIFGDILFEEHRRWAERMCERVGMTAVEPLWGLSTLDLFHDWIACGDEALIVTTRADRLGRDWLGRRLDASMLPEFERLGVDPCGENGEYHTLVTHSSLFSAPLYIAEHGHVERSGCWALDLGVADAAGA